MTNWPWVAGNARDREHRSELAGEERAGRAGVALATGIGSLPGEEFGEACKLVFGELPHLPHLPELPARGPGADMIGRGAGLLSSLPVELYTGRWRVAARPGRDLRRTRDILDRDLDALTQAGQGYAGPLKLQAPGPWTLAANLDLPVGGRLLHDHGAVADLAASLADGLRAHIADVARRLPAATVALQLDEPSVPAVLAGLIPTESGLRTLRSVAASTVESTLRGLVDVVGVPVVIHCCAANPPLRLLAELAERTRKSSAELAERTRKSSTEGESAELAERATEQGGGSGVVAISVDLGQVGTSTAQQDALGEMLDAGIGLFAGVVPSTGASAPSAVAAADAVTALWRRLGFPQERAAAQVVVTPTCGLAGATPTYARAALGACAEAARRLEV